jgi:hypothetical protein
MGTREASQATRGAGSRKHEMGSARDCAWLRDAVLAGLMNRELLPPTRSCAGPNGRPRCAHPPIGPAGRARPPGDSDTTRYLDDRDFGRDPADLFMPIGSKRRAAVEAAARPGTPIIPSGRACYQSPQHRFQGDIAFDRTRFAVLELDPALVEAVEHAHTRLRVLHSLRLK